MNYSKIYNPRTGNFVNVNSTIGQKTLSSYVNQIAGAGKKGKSGRPRGPNYKAPSACKGVAKSACKPPRCSWAAGQKRQYCRLAKADVIRFKNPVSESNRSYALSTEGGSKNARRPKGHGVNHELEEELYGGHKGPCAIGPNGRCKKASKGDGRCMLNKKSGRCVKKSGKKNVGHRKGGKKTQYIGLAAIGPRPGTKGSYGGYRRAMGCDKGHGLEHELEGGYFW